MLSKLLSRMLLPAMLVCVAGCSHAQEPLPAASDLRADGAAARQHKLPIVLFFYSRTCPYCREVEEDYLRPLLAENARTPRILFRSVQTDVDRSLIDFAGQKTTMRDFARSQGVKLVPHLRFVGPDGRALAPDLVGLTLRDFYAGYIEDAITRAGEAMKR